MTRDDPSMRREDARMPLAQDGAVDGLQAGRARSQRMEAAEQVRTPNRSCRRSHLHGRRQDYTRRHANQGRRLRPMRNSWKHLYGICTLQELYTSVTVTGRQRRPPDAGLEVSYHTGRCADLLALQGTPSRAARSPLSRSCSSRHSWAASSAPAPRTASGTSRTMRRGYRDRDLPTMSRSEYAVSRNHFLGRTEGQ